MATPNIAIPREILEMALKLAAASKGDNVDWIQNPDQMNEFIDSVSRKLYSLIRGGA
jgi:hypothetical protein